jgi:hypothetical protein
MVSDSDKSDLNKSDKTGKCRMSRQLFFFTRDSYLFIFNMLQANIVVVSESLSGTKLRNSNRLQILQTLDHALTTSVSASTSSSSI